MIVILLSTITLLSQSLKTLFESSTRVEYEVNLKSAHITSLSRRAFHQNCIFFIRSKSIV